MIARLCLLLFSVVLLSAEDPRFDDQKRLLTPEGYRQWPLVGASLGMSYNEPDVSKAKQEFHHVYLNPEAYRAYRETGKFPEKTMLVMEVYAPAGRSSINRQGQFADKLLRVEAAVKDSSRFDESWAYFDFGEPKLKAAAEAFPVKSCWTCHNEHAAEDNVFTQFYGPLRAKP